MAIVREVPICKICGKPVAKAIYQDFSNVPEWEFIPHICDNYIIDKEVLSEPIQDALYATGRFTTDECDIRILRYIKDAEIKISKKKKYYNLVEERALTIPVVVWRFCAYKSDEDYENGNHYFIKDFLDHTEMKVFSGEHSAKEKLLYSGYCSTYWKIETNVI